MEFTDRYQALGIPYPDINTMCKGHCEGIGFYPLSNPLYKSSVVSTQELTNLEIELWNKAHMEVHSLIGRVKCLYKAFIHFDKIWFKTAFEKCDGWHFVKCPDCNGTGKRK